MMTRTDVARRIGKSVATVRRLEGVELHPIVDEDGVHLFDEAEVERLANRLSGAPQSHEREVPRAHAMSPWLKGELVRRAQEDAEDREHAARLAAQQVELEAFRRRREEEEERRRRHLEREEQSRHDRLAERVDSIRHDIVRQLESATPRELRRMQSDAELMRDLETILGEDL
jgi:hypothetical protein